MKLLDKRKLKVQTEKKMEEKKRNGMMHVLRIDERETATESRLMFSTEADISEQETALDSTK